MHKKVFALFAIILTLAGCTREQKTKEELLNEGIKMLQRARPGEAFVLLKKVLDKDPNYFEARLQLAKTYTVLGNFSAAEKELEKVRRQNPSARDVKIETARILVATKRPDAALKEIAEYLGDASVDCDALQIAGSAHAEKEDFPVSVALLTKAIEVCGPTNTAPSLLLAGVYATSGRSTEAENRIKKVIEKEPENKQALYLLAEVQLSRKDTAGAFKTFDQILRIRPDDVGAQYRKGLLYLDSADYEKAFAIGQELTRKLPDLAEAQRLLGFALFFKKQYADALAPLQKSLARQPNAGAYYILGLTHLARNESEQAVNQFQKTLDLQPSFTAARLQLAQVLLSKKRADEAIQEVKKTLAEERDNPYAHNILGSAYLSKGDYAEGIAELNRALALDPNLPDAHMKKGLVALKRGIGREAETELSAVIDLKPDAVNARRILAVHYLNRNEPLKAIETLRKGSKGEPADAVSCYLIGEAYLRQNKENEAKASYIKAREADPKYDLAYLRLASIYFKQEKQELGIQELRNLLDHSPNNIQALLLLASLDEINGNESNARKTFIRAAETGKTEGVVAAAYYLSRAGDLRGALKIVNDAISRSPASADLALYELKGKILFADKKYRDALGIFETVERRNPQLAFGYITNTYIVMGEPAKAINKVQAEIKKNPTALNLRAELSKIQLKAGDRQGALETAREIIRKTPGSPVGYFSLALVHQQSGEMDRAIEVLKSGPKTRDVQTGIFLSSLYASRKKYTQALAECAGVQGAKPGAELVLFQKAMILQAMGKNREAETEYEKVVRMSPNNGMALNNLACIYTAENRNLQQALLYATRAMILLPGNDMVRDTLGFALVKTGRVEQGLKMLEKVSGSNPANATVHYHLGVAYQESGKSEMAVEHLQKALSSGDFPEARDATTLLNKIRKTKS